MNKILVTRFAGFLWFLLIVFFSAIMLQIALPYFTFDMQVDFLRTKQGIIHLWWWRYAFYIHVATSLLTLLAGAIQFNRQIQQNKPLLHKTTGKIYVATVLLLGGPSGFILALYANGGWAARTGFILLSVLWILFTLIAYSLAMKKNFELHEKWMIRSYALTMAAISLRLLAFVLPHLVLMKGRSAYILLAWTSWILNMIIAELIILNRNSIQWRNSHT